MAYLESFQRRLKQIEFFGSFDDYYYCCILAVDMHSYPLRDYLKYMAWNQKSVSLFLDLNTRLKASSGDENAMMDQEDTKLSLASTWSHDLFGKGNNDLHPAETFILISP